MSSPTDCSFSKGTWAGRGLDGGWGPGGSVWKGRRGLVGERVWKGEEPQEEVSKEEGDLQGKVWIGSRASGHTEDGGSS